MDLNTDEEKEMVETIYMNAIDGLSEDDKRLPQIRHSFHQFQSTKAVPTIQAELEEAKEKTDAIAIPDETVIAAYVSIESSIAQLKQQMRNIINTPQHALPFLQAGRVLRVRDDAGNVGWGTVLNFKKQEA